MVRLVYRDPSMKPYRVSVVVATKNRSALLSEAIRSIQALQGPDLDLEILVVDNGSTDDTPEVACSLGLELLHCGHTSPPGPAAVRNVGIRAATGDYVAFLDDDDLYLPEHIRPQVALLEQRPELMACVGQVVPIDAASGDRLGDPSPASLPASGDVFEPFLAYWPQIGSLVIRREVRDTVGYICPSLTTSADWDWTLRIALQHRVGFVPVPGVLFRARPPATAYEDEETWFRAWVNRRVFWQTVRRAGPRRLSPVRILRHALRYEGSYAGYFLISAAIHAEAGERQRARQSLARAMMISPLHVAASVARRPSALGWMTRAWLGA
jgi:glycosyltransferase involved in cell wall biosynthesis